MAETAAPPKPLRQHVFRPDFTPATPAPSDVAEIGQVLSPLGRLAAATGNLLRLGAPRQIAAFGGGEGFLVRMGRDQLVYERHGPIAAWDEMDPEIVEAAGHRTWEPMAPLFPSRGELTELLKELRLVQWFAYRGGSSNLWSYQLKGQVLNQKIIGQACLGLFQVDLILNAQQFPRTRLCLSFDHGRLWLWGSAKTDYLAACTSRTPSAFQLQQVAQLGETFLCT